MLNISIIIVHFHDITFMFIDNVLFHNYNFYLKIFLKIEYVYVGFLDQLSLVFVEVVPVVFVDVYLDLILSLLVEELLISVEINAGINYYLNVPSTTWTILNIHHDLRVIWPK